MQQPITPRCGIGEISCALEMTAHGLFDQTQNPVQAENCANLLLVLSDYLRWWYYCQESE